MAVFLSTYVNKVDRKGRVSVPAERQITIILGNIINWLAD